jgi:hypothetical protein
MQNSQRSLLIRGLLLSVLLTIVPIFDGQSEETFTLIGTVKRSNGSAKPGVEVGFEPRGYFATTDQNGRFVIPNFVTGNYSVTVRQGSRYQKFNRQINVGGTLDLVIHW